MTDPGTPDIVRDYLARLEAAMVGIPEETTRDIIGAIREELFGLDAAAAAKRIRRFGDPQFIASEARAAGSMAATAAETEAAAPAAVAPAAETAPAASTRSTTSGSAATATATETASPASPRTGEPRWYAVISALVLMFGSFAVPVLGTVAGFVMMWFSSAWTRTEKWIATLIPVASFGIIALASMLPRSVAAPVDPIEAGGGSGGSGGGSDFFAPTMEGFVPGSLAVWHLGVIVLVLVPVAVGIGLLWRATRYWAAAGRR